MKLSDEFQKQVIDPAQLGKPVTNTKLLYVIKKIIEGLEKLGELNSGS
jgi:hypothetical protein